MAHTLFCQGNDRGGKGCRGESVALTLGALRLAHLRTSLLQAPTLSHHSRELFPHFFPGDSFILLLGVFLSLSAGLSSQRETCVITFIVCFFVVVAII